MNIPEFIDSKFRFTIMVAKRAKQLINGAPKLSESESENPITTAIEEVSTGKVSYDIINSAGVYFGEEEVSDEDLDIESGQGSEDLIESDMVQAEESEENNQSADESPADSGEEETESEKGTD